MSKITKKITGILLAFVMVLTTMISSGFQVEAAGVNALQEGIYTGAVDKHVETMNSDIHYGITLEVKEGKYSYAVDIVVADMDYTGKESETGTYTVSEDTLTLSGPKMKKVVVKDAETIDLTGVLSSFAGGVDATVTLTKSNAPAPALEDNLVSGDYVLVEEDYDDAATMKLPIYIRISGDKDSRRFNIYSYKEHVADFGTDKGSGTIAFDASTGVYTMTFETVESKKGETTTFELNGKGIKFTSALHYGGAKMNIVDENGNFIPYTANPAPKAEAEDKLVSGDYVLVEDDYDASAMMKLPMYIRISGDQDNRRFNIYPYKDHVVDFETDKGSGTIALDASTGVYTMTFETVESKKGETTTFELDGDGIKFTSALHYGGAKMNILDEEGNFLPFTAHPAPKAEAEDKLVSGDYVLTEKDYDASAIMKMPAFIKVSGEAANRRFNIYPYADNKADFGTDKGSGTIAFDASTGVYTMTFETVESKKGETTTFVLDGDGIKFTSPLHYGGAKMNIVDENGNFIPYTAHPLGNSEADVRAFVARLYTEVLGREAEEDGLNAWTEVLTSQKESGAQVAKGFVDSAEFKAKDISDKEFVQIMYKTFLGREADDLGLESWIKVLDDGLSRLSVFRGFVESPEFTKICESYGIIRGEAELKAPMDQVANEKTTKFVARLYKVFLGRKGDADGINGWVSQLASGKNNAKQAAHGFVMSEEFQSKNLSNEEYVKTIYIGVLDREADPVGLADWVEVLEKGGSREDIFYGFADSPEFRDLARSYNLNGDWNAGK